MNDNLPELRDIHLPEGVSFFPPAYGWYVIGLGIGICFLLIKSYFLWRRKSRKYYALKVLKTLETEEIISAVAQISELLRRICIYRYPKAVALSGKAWIEFILQHSKMNLSQPNQILLLNAPYMNAKTKGYDSQNLQDIINFAQIWIGENL